MKKHVQRGCVTLLALMPAMIAQAENWPAWRGERGTGVVTESGVPLEWSPDENVKWKVPLPAPGNSTPIVWEDRVFITQAEEEGKRRSLMCFRKGDGELLWSQSVEYTEPEPTHRTNPYCSSSPATDGRRVIVWHGSAGVFAYDLEGNELWRRDFGKFEHVWGNASSPVLHGESVFLSLGPGPNTFLVALDAGSGRELWRNDALIPEGKRLGDNGGAWSTPVLYEDGGRTLLLLSVPFELAAFDPQTGEKVWSCGGLTRLVYTSPLVADGVAVAMSGFGGSAIGVRTGGSGDVTESHRLWLHERNPQRVGSGVIAGGHLYIVHDTGVAWCLDVETGERKWEHRLGGAWASMCHADGRLYVIDKGGATHVLAVNPSECQVLATNRLGEHTHASLAFSGRQIFIRTYEHLYCIEERH